MLRWLIFAREGEVLVGLDNYEKGEMSAGICWGTESRRDPELIVAEVIFSRSACLVEKDPFRRGVRGLAEVETRCHLAAFAGMLTPG